MDPIADTARYTAPDTARRRGGADTRSRSGRAYDWLKQGLLTGEFPLAQRLAEERLAREIDVSRTPIREALSRLHAEGLVDRHPDGGYHPSIPDLVSIAELYEVRAALEQAALTRPATSNRRHDRAALEQLCDDWRGLRAELDEAPSSEFVLLDEDFHVRLASAAGNEQLVTSLVHVNERIRIVRMHDFLTAERIEATVDQHLGVVEAALAGDLDLATGRLARHLDESAAVVQDRAARAIGRMLRGRDR